MKQFLPVLMIIAAPAFAEPISYDIDKANSRVGFAYSFDNRQIEGEFNTYTSDIIIDFDKIANSRVNVTLNTGSATAGFAFATQGIKAPNMLDAKSHPEIRFQSTKVTGSGNTAKIDGTVTIKGVSKPLTLTAQLFRSADSLASERDNLKMRVLGSLDRFDFGVSGFPQLVGKELDITIDANITRQN